MVRESYQNCKEIHCTLNCWVIQTMLSLQNLLAQSSAVTTAWETICRESFRFWLITTQITLWRSWKKCLGYWRRKIRVLSGSGYVLKIKDLHLIRVKTPKALTNNVNHSSANSSLMKRVTPPKSPEQSAMSKIWSKIESYFHGLASAWAKKRLTYFRSLSNSWQWVHLRKVWGSSGRLLVSKAITTLSRPLQKAKVKLMNLLKARKKTPYKRRKVLVWTNIPTMHATLPLTNGKNYQTWLQFKYTAPDKYVICSQAISKLPSTATHSSSVRRSIIWELKSQGSLIALLYSQNQCGELRKTMKDKSKKMRMITVIFQSQQPRIWQI